MRKRPTILLVGCLLFLFPLFFVSAYDAKITHPNLTEITVDFYNQSFSGPVLNATEKQLLMQGSIDEDDNTRSINHFYDPVFNKTWQFGGAEYVFPSLTAKDWGQNPFAQAVYDPLYLALVGPIVKSPVFSRANFTWQQAIYKYVKGDRVDAFKSLGHILHLIQDMSVPEHTRGNVHIFFIPNAGSPYESYAAKSNKSFYEQTRNSVQNKKPIIKNSLNAYFDEIAFYSNNYFYSPDTLPPTEYKLPEIIYPDVAEIGEDKVTRYYLLGADEEGNLFHLAKKQTNWRVQSGLYLYTLQDDKVLQDYWEHLSKKAVLTGAGVINLFFKEAEKAKADPKFVSKNESNILIAMIGGLTDFINNIFQQNQDFIIMDSEDLDGTISPEQTTTTIKPSVTTTKLSTTTTKPLKSVTSTAKQTTTTTTKSTTTTTKQTTTTTTKPTTTTTKQTTTTTQPASQINICNFATSQAPLQNKVIINEVAWMGTQNSANDEWIELKNISSQQVDISNWQLLDEDGQIKIAFEQGSKIPAHSFYLLERTDDDSIPFIAADYIYTGILNNADEGLRLFDDSCRLQDQILANPDWPAGDNSQKWTMERSNSLSWHTYNGIGQNGIFGTPKRENSQPAVSPSGGGSSSSSTTTTITTTTTTTLPPIDYPKILINEIKVSGKDEDGSVIVYDEFIELFNPNDFEVDLTGWYLQKKTSQGEDFSSLVPADLLDNKKINAFDYVLITHSSSAYAQIADILISNYSITDNNAAILKNPNREIVDKVGFGEANDCEGECALHPEPGQSIQRKYVDGNFLDSDNNLNDFEIQNCPSPKSIFSEECIIPTTTTTIAPSSPTIPYITEFSWHPFEKDSSRIVVDFKTDSYPFIPSTGQTGNIFTAMAFYLHSDFDNASSTFGVPLNYLGDKYNWGLSSSTLGLIVSYPNYVSESLGAGSIIFTTDATLAVNSGAPRRWSYRIDQLPNNNHFIINVVGTTQGQGLNFTPDQYVTIGYYGYSTGYLKLIAYDDTKFYFDSSKYYHQPANVQNFSVECDNENCENLIFAWKPAFDEDLGDTLKYDIHYVFAKQGNDLNNNDLIQQSWQWSSSQNVLGEPIFDAQTNKFQLQVPIKDIYYINVKRLPGVPLDVFFGIKAEDSVGLKSETPNIVFLHIPPIVPETTTTTSPQ